MAPNTMHKTFKEIKIHTARCDQCNKHNSDTIYRCEDCSEQCCTPCWKTQGEDGKHLLNHASTVIVPADDVGKRKVKGTKPAKVIKHPAKKAGVKDKNLAKKPLVRKRKVIIGDDDNSNDHTVDIEMEEEQDIPEALTTRKIANQVGRDHVKGELEVLDDYGDSPDPEAVVLPIPHSRHPTHKAKKAVSSRNFATTVAKNSVQGSGKQANSKDEVVVDEGNTTDHDLPVLPPTMSAISNISNEVLKLSNANKRKRSEASSEYCDVSINHHAAKKARMNTIPDSGVDASSRPLAPTKIARPEDMELAENLIHFSRAAAQYSPTPSPPSSKTTNGMNTQVNTPHVSTSSSTARSSVSYTDLPVWPPAPAPNRESASSATRTFPPCHTYRERDASLQAQKQPSAIPAPRQAMLNATWFPKDNKDEAEVLTPTSNSTHIVSPAANIIKVLETHEAFEQEPLVDTKQALQFKRAREAAAANAAYLQAERDRKAAGGVQVFQVVETATETKTVETPLRKGMAHVGNAVSA